MAQKTNEFWIFRASRASWLPRIPRKKQKNRIKAKKKLARYGKKCVLLGMKSDNKTKGHAMGNFEYSHKPKRYENMELIMSVGSAINTKNGMVYPIKKNSGAVLWNEGFNIVDAWYDYDNNYKWFLQIDVFDKKIVNDVILKLITINVKKS